MSELIQHEVFFYAIAFIIFMALAFVYGRKPALQWIDEEIGHIRAELDAAQKLRAEAEALLADCRVRQARAEADAQEILSNARTQVEAMRQQSAAELAASLARHQHMAKERIRLAEVEAYDEVRAAAIDAAMSIARRTLQDGLSDADAATLVGQAVADVPAMNSPRSKAA